MRENTNAERLRKLEAYKRIINLMLSAVGLLLEVGIFAFFWFYNFHPSLVDSLRFYRMGHLLEFAIYGVLLFALSNMYGGLRLGYLKNAEIIFSQIFSMVVTNVVIYAQLSLMAMELFLPQFWLIMSVAQMMAIVLWTNIATRIYRSLFPPRKLFLIHGDRSIQDIVNKLESRKDKYKIAGCSHVNKGIEALCKEISAGYESGEYQAVVLWDVSVEERNYFLKYCYGHSIRIYIMPKITDVILMGAEELNLFDSPILLTREYSLTMEQRFVKRTIDLICALLLLVAASPFMLLTAIAIKLYDGGPVLYKQVRCTINQREFQIMKFRSMRTDAEKDGVARLAKKNDDRITPVGRFIRKVRIDELPQLFNIIKGDMSFIGPRPERPEIIAQYVEIMPEFAYRMKVKAGLAGYAQVYGKYNTTPYDKLKLDLTYIGRYSILMDIKLMFLTLKILFWPDSTEGVENEQITAFKEERKQESRRSADDTKV